LYTSLEDWYKSKKNNLLNSYTSISN
jgi:hypothetical protein